MSYDGLRKLVPGWLRREVFHFEERIVAEISRFSASLAPGAKVLDAGAGEGQYRNYFRQQRYVGVDLGIGDVDWNYEGLDCIADLLQLPLRDQSFDALVSVVTLEHVTDPSLVIAEMSRVARPGASLFLVVPHEWEVHQHPHDYWRFTRFGVALLLDRQGWEILSIEPGGGFFRLLSRRLMNGLQFAPSWLMPLLAVFVVPVALVLGGMDGLDRRRDFTVGYICWAKRKTK
ncbi:class I SAM-dependent methyltransferase [Bryobacter aggregatus]|uniref:class I SAM-dependent methyltransferase n=1 Tax=Bryobacter aggregatus TaxID=360054 RepID=UPI00068BE56F|nr:class I SAM-dependent methyltransferase [Bryobacter aggregatus]